MHCCEVTVLINLAMNTCTTVLQTRVLKWEFGPDFLLLAMKVQGKRNQTGKRKSERRKLHKKSLFFLSRSAIFLLQGRIRIHIIFMSAGQNFSRGKKEL